MTNRKYMIVVQDIVGSSGNWTTNYLPGPTFDHRAEALTHGLKVLGHDDFNVATLEGDRLVAFGWGDDDFGPDAGYDLAEITRHLSTAEIDG